MATSAAKAGPAEAREGSEGDLGERGTRAPLTLRRSCEESRGQPCEPHRAGTESCPGCGGEALAKTQALSWPLEIAVESRRPGRGRLSVPDRIPVVDGLMAATARVHSLTLATRNLKDVAR